MKRKGSINREKCVACGACIKECPRSALSVHHGCYAVVNEDICLGCGICERTCPALAISMKERTCPESANSIKEREVTDEK